MRFLLETSAKNLPLRQIPYFLFCNFPSRTNWSCLKYVHIPTGKQRYGLRIAFSPRCTCLEVCECRMVCPQTGKLQGFHASLWQHVKSQEESLWAEAALRHAACWNEIHVPRRCKKYICCTVFKKVNFKACCHVLSQYPAQRSLPYS